MAYKYQHIDCYLRTDLHLTGIWLTAVVDDVVAVTIGWLPSDANVDDS